MTRRILKITASHSLNILRGSLNILRGSLNILRGKMNILRGKQISETLINTSFSGGVFSLTDYQ